MNSLPARAPLATSARASRASPFGSTTIAPMPRSIARSGHPGLRDGLARAGRADEQRVRAAVRRRRTGSRRGVRARRGRRSTRPPRNQRIARRVRRRDASAPAPRRNESLGCAGARRPRRGRRPHSRSSRCQRRPLQRRAEGRDEQRPARERRSAGAQQAIDGERDRRPAPMQPFARSSRARERRRRDRAADQRLRLRASARALRTAPAGAELQRFEEWS